MRARKHASHHPLLSTSTKHIPHTIHEWKVYCQINVNRFRGPLFSHSCLSRYRTPTNSKFFKYISPRKFNSSSVILGSTPLARCSPYSTYCFGMCDLWRVRVCAVHVFAACSNASSKIRQTQILLYIFSMYDMWKWI